MAGTRTVAVVFTGSAHKKHVAPARLQPKQQRCPTNIGMKLLNVAMTRTNLVASRATPNA
jgi:hypothetical protein